MNWPASNTLEMKSELFAGLPICKIEKAGKLKFKCKVGTYTLNATYDGFTAITAGYTLKLKQGKFTNSILSTETSDNVVLTVTKAGPDTFDVTVDVKKFDDNNKYLYVKVCPTNTNYFCSVDVVGQIKLETES